MDRSPQRKQQHVAGRWLARLVGTTTGRHSSPLRTLVCGYAPLLCIALAGCGKDDGRIEVFPTQGKVLVNGQPADGARVVFYPEAPEVDFKKMPTPAATTDASGQYQLESYKPKDGAPAGNYKVTVVWLEPPPPNAQGIFDQKDRLGGRFASPDSSKLTATVEDGGGEIPPFELK